MSQFGFAAALAVAAGLCAVVLVAAAYFVGSPTPGWLAALVVVALAAAVIATVWAAFAS